MRNLIVCANKKIDSGQIDEIKQLKSFKVMNSEDINLIFNRDTLNVISEQEYNKLKDYNLYAFSFDITNYLKDYRAALNYLYELFGGELLVFDASIKRYINKYELSYYLENKLIVSKLYNVEIKQQGNKCVYETVGLNSFAQSEIKFISYDAYNEFDLRFFKVAVDNYLIASKAKVFINEVQVEYFITQLENEKIIKINKPEKQIRYHFIENEYIEAIKKDAIKHNYKYFQWMYKHKLIEGQYVINSQKVNDIENFLIEYVDDFMIITDEIVYDQFNLFYAIGKNSLKV